MKTNQEIILRIKELIKTMDIPDFRRNDVAWLNRNMVIRNANHENFEQALKLIKKLYK